MIGVGCASAAAVELCKAVGTFLVGIDVAALELIADAGVGDALIDATEPETFLSHELVAR